MPADRQSRWMPAWLALVRTHTRFWEQVQAQMRRDNGLTMARYDVLAHLDMAGGRLGLTELATAIPLLSQSGLSKLLDRMEPPAWSAVTPTRATPAPPSPRSLRAVRHWSGRPGTPTTSFCGTPSPQPSTTPTWPTWPASWTGSAVPSRRPPGRSLTAGYPATSDLAGLAGRSPRASRRAWCHCPGIRAIVDEQPAAPQWRRGAAGTDMRDVRAGR